MQIEHRVVADGKQYAKIIAFRCDLEVLPKKKILTAAFLKCQVPRTVVSSAHFRICMRLL